MHSSIRANGSGGAGTGAGALPARVCVCDWDVEAPPDARVHGEEFSTEQGLREQQQQQQTREAAAAAAAAAAAGGEGGGGAAESVEVGALPLAVTFDLVLATDVIYLETHAMQLPRVVRGRLARGGRLLAMVPVRDEAHARTFVRGLRECGMEVRATRVETTSQT